MVFEGLKNLDGIRQNGRSSYDIKQQMDSQI